EDVLEDLALDRRQRWWRAHAPAARLPADPVYRLVPHHHHEPGGEPCPRLAALRESAQQSQVVRGQCLTNLREDVRDLVVRRERAPNGGGDEAPIPIDEEIPGRLGVARIERSPPRFH